MDASRQKKDYALLLILAIAWIALFQGPLRGLFSVSLHNELYSHVPLIPVISGYFLYTMRKEIFRESGSDLRGLVPVALSVVVYLIATAYDGALTVNDTLSLKIFSSVLFFAGAFICRYGTGASKRALFPLAFLILMAPIPSAVVSVVVSLLQHASAEISYYIFKLTGVPIYREGLVFHLPRVSIEVAEQCSGIRSSIGLFITSILAGKMFLNRAPGRLVLMLAILPISVIKNGVRIVTLSLLAVYVDISFLTNSFLHNNGGVFFFLLALVLMGGVLAVLRRFADGRT